MSFVDRRFDPLVAEDALEARYLVELEALKRLHIEDLTRLVAQHEQDLARCEARYQIAREHVWNDNGSPRRTRAVA